MRGQSPLARTPEGPPNGHRAGRRSSLTSNPGCVATSRGLIPYPRPTIGFGAARRGHASKVPAATAGGRLAGPRRTSGSSLAPTCCPSAPRAPVGRPGGPGRRRGRVRGNGPCPPDRRLRGCLRRSPRGRGVRGRTAEVPAVFPGAPPGVHRRADGRGVRRRPGVRERACTSTRSSGCSSTTRTRSGPAPCGSWRSRPRRGSNGRATPGPRGPVPPPTRPDRRLGPRRPRRLGGARALARRPAPGCARQHDPWRRRSAITATFAFIRRRRAGRHLPDREAPARDEREPRKAVGWALARRRPRPSGSRPSSMRMPRRCRGRPSATRSRSWRPRSVSGCSLGRTG